MKSTWQVQLKRAIQHPSTLIFLGTALVLTGSAIYLVDRLFASFDLSADSVLLLVGTVLLIASGIVMLWIRGAALQWHAAQGILERVNRQQRALAELNHHLVNAEQETQIINALLDFILQVTPIVGVSFVPFDERERPLAAISRGTIPPDTMGVWSEYLARPEARQRCQICEVHHSLADSTCPLKPPTELTELSKVRELHCRRLWCGARQIGMITLYSATEASLPDDVTQLLDTVFSDVALRLDSLRLRRREVEALHQLQNLRNKRDINQLLQVMLKNTLRIFDADFTMALVQNPGDDKQMQTLMRGTITEEVEVFSEGMLHAALQAKEPMLVDNLHGLHKNAQPGTTLLVTPLRVHENPPFGALLVGGYQPVEFGNRHIELLRVIAGQIALLVQNINLTTQLEYHAVVSERARLAREIHDGLAQTLGYLKLQGAQMRTYLKQGDTTRLQQSLEAIYRAISEAYLDVREAIDGLRTTSEKDFSQWIQETLDDFQKHAGLSVEPENLDLLDTLPLEIQVQLLRVIQESLTNIRKHAHASHVVLRVWQSNKQEISLEIRDNGVGFAPEDVSPVVRHGLEGMRERAELLGAEFQIISKHNQGTSILLHIPIQEDTLA